MEQYLAGVELVSTLRSFHFTELYPIINHCKMVHQIVATGSIQGYYDPWNH